MKTLDVILQNKRISKARKYVRKNDAVLDIGSVEGIMFEKMRDLISSGTGIDPTLKQETKTDLYHLIPGYFPDVVPAGKTFDAITMLAVLEHIPADKQQALVENCWKYLNPGGRVIITVPSPAVDRILEILTFFKLVDGMSLEEHYGFEAKDTGNLFTGKYFKMLHHSTFQLGLNHLFVFEKI